MLNVLSALEKSQGRGQKPENRDRNKLKLDQPTKDEVNKNIENNEKRNRNRNDQIILDQSKLDKWINSVSSSDSGNYNDDDDEHNNSDNGSFYDDAKIYST